MKSHTYKLTAYPKEIKLRDGRKCVLKPMTAMDKDALQDFFRRLSPEDRYYFKDDVTDPQVIEKWVQDVDYDRSLPLLAWVDDAIAADGTLHRSRANARRHVGKIRISVAPDMRECGLGTTILQELTQIANENGLERLLLEAVVDKEAAAIKAAEFVGFVRAGILPGHARDADGHPRDIVLLEMPLGKWLEWWGF